jgi:hypothetical protein
MYVYRCTPFHATLIWLEWCAKCNQEGMTMLRKFWGIEPQGKVEQRSGQVSNVYNLGDYR